MRVIRPPARLRAAGLLFLLTAPLIALQLAIALRVSVLAISPRVISIWTACAFALSLVPAVTLFRGRPSALNLSTASLGVWVLLSLVASFVFHSPALGFFALFLAAGSSALLVWVRMQAKEAFFDPGLKWYQRLPKPIPGLSCVARPEGSEARGEFKVSRLSPAGAFIFSDRPNLEPLAASSGAVDLEFKFRDRWLKCTGLPVVEIDRGGGAGWGVRFSPISPDLRKNLGDFIEQIRGEGYVE